MTDSSTELISYKCKHFTIKELVSKKVYEDRGDKAWALFDPRALITLDALRDRVNVPLTVNNWSYKTPGTAQYRGLRTEGTPYFSPYSQHTFGRAFDVVSNHITAEEMRQIIFKERSELFPYITAVELGTSWLHFDVRNNIHSNDPNELLTFYP